MSIDKKQNIYTTVENQLGRKNAFCPYPGKMFTLGTAAIALYWLSLTGMVIYGIHYHGLTGDSRRVIINRSDKGEPLGKSKQAPGSPRRQNHP